MNTQRGTLFFDRWRFLTIVCLLLLQCTALWFAGRIVWGERGLGIWSGAWTDTTSQNLFDPYSLSHALHGVLLFWLLLPAARWISAGWRWVLAVAVEVGWEVLENSPIIIERYRTETASLNYFGDSILNSLGDTLSMAAGYLFAASFPWYASVVLFVGFELLGLLLACDNLTLNVLMLIYPLDVIKHWQLQLLPPTAALAGGRNCRRRDRRNRNKPGDHRGND